LTKLPGAKIESGTPGTADGKPIAFLEGASNVFFANVG
jgi:hypothetical protein